MDLVVRQWHSPWPQDSQTFHLARKGRNWSHMPSPSYDLAQRAKVFKALGHPSRLMMVEALGQGEKCVCELRELVGSDISTVSKHLTILKEAGIVQDERRGTNVYYSLRMLCVSSFLGCVRRFFTQQLEEYSNHLNMLRQNADR